MKILILNGPAESGKGTVAKFLEMTMKKRIFEYSSIDYVKEVAIDKFGWNEKKDKKGRELLYKIKKLMILYNDFPTKKVVSKMILAEKSKSYDLMVVDVREPDEIDKLVQECKNHKIQCTTIRVLNKEKELEAELEKLCLSDRVYGQYDYDLYIDNNGTLEELESNVKDIFTKNPKTI